MNILYIHNAPLESEQANLIQVISMCQAFAELGNNVTLIIEKSKFEFEINSFIEDRFGFLPKFNVIAYQGNFSVFGRFKQLTLFISNLNKVIKKALKIQKYDIIFLRNPIVLFFIIWKNQPYIFEIHNNILHYKSRILNSILTFLLLRAVKSKNCKKVIVISEALKNYWITKQISDKKILVLHDGFNHKAFEQEISCKNARSILKLPTGKKIVTYSGSLYADRGIELIFKCARQIPEAIFLILGGPKEKVEYYAKMQSKMNLKNIILIGRVNPRTVPIYLFASDVLLLIFTTNVPTINYCSPLKVFEYMAAGRIIIGHSFPTIKEVLTDKKNAILVEPKDEELFINNVRNVLNEDYSYLGKFSRELAFSKYSWIKRANIIKRTLLDQN